MSSFGLSNMQATITDVQYQVTSSSYIDSRIENRIQELMPSFESADNTSGSESSAEVDAAIPPLVAIEQVITGDLSDGISLSPPPVAAAASDTRTDHGHVRVELSLQQHDTINNVCQCSCHWPVTVKSPSWLGNAVGVLMLRWQRNPQACTKPSCKMCHRLGKRIMRMQYYLPWWMLGRIIQLESAYRSARRLVSFKSSNTIPQDSAVFLLAQHNNLTGIKKLFSEGLASPFDITPSGRTPLHVGLNRL